VKVLLTGARSLLLSNVAQLLHERGDEVVCLQRNKAQFAGADDVEQVLADIRDTDAVQKASHGCDAIIHGAARVGVVGTASEFREVNIDGTTNMLLAAHVNDVHRFVHVSTPSVAHSGSSIIGAPAEPAVIGRKGSYYAETKAVAEQIALAANSSHMASVAIRPHLVWGPADTQLVGRIVERAKQGRLVMVGSGSALVDATYIDNAVTALVAAVDAAKPGATCAGNAYVIANGEPRTVHELMLGICTAAGIAFSPRHVSISLALKIGSAMEWMWPRLRAGEPPLTRFVAEQLGTAHWFDPRPAQNDLHWEPHVTMDEGFSLLHQWFVANPVYKR
jgi:nucleoside-diphosphate-sugar epimerase